MAFETKLLTNKTTFVQADTTSFKKVVQMLTGSSETVKQSTTTTRPDLAARNPIPAMKTGPDKKPSKLYERRSSLKNFKINPLAPGFTNDKGFSGSSRNPNAPEIMSPSLLDFPSLVLSPVTPLLSDPFNRSPTNDCSPNLDVEAEENAIAEKGFYLHPSPATTPRREDVPFSGNDHEDGYKHLGEVNDIADYFNILNAPRTTVLLRMLPVIFKGASKDWLMTLTPGAITTWAQMCEQFFEQFCTPSKISKLKKAIANF
ncbi:hypothetical protein Lser_V15G41627 [Lactuca serriola]